MGRIATTGRYEPHPLPRYQGTIRLVQGRRQNYPNAWEALFLIDGRWTQPAVLRTDDKMEAAHNATEEFARRSAGIVPKPKADLKTFRNAALKTVERLKQDEAHVRAAQGDGKAAKFRLKIRRIQNVLVPAMGDMTVAAVNDPDFLDRWQRGYRVTGRSKSATPRHPKKSTMGNIAGAFAEVMKDARDLQWISLKTVVSMSQKHFKKGERRPTFSRPEMLRIKNWMTDEWIEAGHTTLKRENRYMLRALVGVMASTGIRPGLEVESLEHGQVEPWQRGSRIFIRNNQGKGEEGRYAYLEARDVWPAETLLHDYLAWHRPSSGLHLFARPSDGKYSTFEVTFGCLLEELGLRQDPMTGRNRTLYSLRHYYCTQQLLRGTNIALVAGCMGTSIQMIALHYSHVLKEMQAHMLTGSTDVKGRLQGAIMQIIPDPHPETEAQRDASEADDEARRRLQEDYTI